LLLKSKANYLSAAKDGTFLWHVVSSIKPTTQFAKQIQHIPWLGVAKLFCVSVVPKPKED